MEREITPQELEDEITKGNADIVVYEHAKSFGMTLDPLREKRVQELLARLLVVRDRIRWMKNNSPGVTTEDVNKTYYAHLNALHQWNHQVTGEIIATLRGGGRS